VKYADECAEPIELVFDVLVILFMFSKTIGYVWHCRLMMKRKFMMMMMMMTTTMMMKLLMRMKFRI